VQYSMTSSVLSALSAVVSEVTVEAVCAAASEARVSIAALSAVYNMIHPDCASARRGGRVSGSQGRFSGPILRRLPDGTGPLAGTNLPTARYTVARRCE
jgi:hypothetical protein